MCSKLVDKTLTCDMKDTDCFVLYLDHGFEPKYLTTQPSDSHPEKLPLPSLLVLGNINLPNIVKTDTFLRCKLQ